MNHARIPQIVILTAFLLGAPAIVSAAGGLTYPGNGPARDPTGRWSIEWRAATEDTPHRLILQDLRSGQASVLLEFNRHVDALWAPDGSAVAITDYSDSDASSVFVVRPQQPEKAIDVEQMLVLKIGRIPGLYENGHRYFEAVRWSTRDRLEFEVHAHDAHPGVEYREVFEFRLRTGEVRRASGR